MYRDRYQTNTNEQTEADGQEQIDSLTEEQRRTHGKEGQAGHTKSQRVREGNKRKAHREGCSKLGEVGP